MGNKRGENMSELIGKIIKELEHVFDVLKSAIDINRKRIVELERRIKELEVTTLTLFNRMDKK